ncbi:hypothetical protein CHUAL_002985 [Chamberlinius hualienensis]
MAGNIIIGIQSPNGAKRISTTTNALVRQFYQQVKDTFNFHGDQKFCLYKDRSRSTEIDANNSGRLSYYKIKHGDVIFLHTLNQVPDAVNDIDGDDRLNVESSTSSSLPNSVSKSLNLAMDDVDLALLKIDGRIERQPDEKYCNHGLHSKCIHCSSIEPYDEKYLHEQNIKHMSFHSYLRKLQGGVDKGKFMALENISCRIKTGCKEHLPWPKGICSKCQPNAVTLSRQIYRHLDNVVFENRQIVEGFLNYWRTTGHQRIGMLYGHYEVHKDVPLGIKATVAAIYEPPQESSRDSIKLPPDWEIDPVINEVAQRLGLQMVGWIFTDLVAEDVAKGTVKHVRHGTSHFLSAQEVITAGYFQNKHPNPCQSSPTGYFGSKFVTVCVTGDVNNQVHMEGYQVSNQCMALVRDDCLVPTKDVPELAYVRESTNEQYVPDVYYSGRDEYGSEVTRLARPLPIEYLLVDVPVSTPLEPKYTFYVNSKYKSFPVENRMLDGHIQDFSRLAVYLKQFPPDQFLQAISDFHLLIYLASMDMLPMRDSMCPLLEAVRSKDVEKALEWSNSDCWKTLEELLNSDGMLPSTSSGLSDDAAEQLWTCAHCTYLNPSNCNYCEMCALPR